jgi:hypothetical protein
MKKLKNLQEFQRNSHESLWKAYAQMHKLITMTQNVMEA